MNARIALACAFAAGFTAPSLAEPGRLGTLPIGAYICSEPGDAGGDAWIVLPDRGFTIETGSAYQSAKGSGTYLLTGDLVTFTRGPMKNQRFRRTGNSTLRWLDADGNPGRVRCVRSAGRS